MSNVPVMAINQSSKPATNPVGNLPPFIAMPSSSAQLTDRISYSPTILEEVNEVAKDEMKQVSTIEIKKSEYNFCFSKV